MSVKPFEQQGNFTQVHNIVFDEIMSQVKPTSFKVLMAIIRKTIGWQKLEDDISFSQLRDITGISSNSTLYSATEELSDLGLILVTKGDYETSTNYRLNTNYEITPSENCNTPLQKSEHPLYKNCNTPITKIVNTKETLLNTSKEKRGGAKNAPAPKLSKIEREPKPAAVHAYNRIARLWPDKVLWRIIDDTIGDKPESLARFEAVVMAYIGAGWNKRNINGMLDFYRRGEIPGATTERGNNGLRKGNRGTQDDEWAEYTAKSQEALAARIAAVTVS